MASFLQVVDISSETNPCGTTFQGQTNSNLGLSGSWTTQTLDSGFPTLRVSGADYVGIIKRGVPGSGAYGYGILFPSWHRAVPTTGGTTGGCMNCNMTGAYTLGIYGQALDVPQ